MDVLSDIPRHDEPPSGMESLGEDQQGVPSVKVAMLGASGVGKTSLCLKFIDPTTTDTNPNSTLGSAFWRKEVQVPPDNKRYWLDIWDTAGQERFKSLVKMYYREAKIVVAVFDITRRETYLSLQDTIHTVIQETGVHPMLVGNKSDLEGSRQVQGEEARKYALENGLIYFESTATDGEGVERMFKEFATQYSATRGPASPTGGYEKGSVRLEEKPASSATRSCCGGGQSID